MVLPVSTLLLQTTPTEVGRMLRADAVGLVLGSFLLALALSAAVVYVSFLRKEPSLAWFAVFALAYGVRLLAQTEAFRALFEAPPLFWSYLISTLTNLIGLSIVLFLRALFPAWARFLGWTAGLLGLFATAAVAADVVTGRPFAAQTPNNVFAIAFLLVALGFLFRPGLSPSRELTTFRVGLVSFALAAFVDNLHGLGVPGLPRQSVEALGFAVLIGCLGTVVTRRIFENAQRLVSLDRELSVARRIQEALLPVATPRLADIAIAARFRPMTAVAG
ncbi:MAG TPA: 7TM diverse intracellular signaling domain-containing protein, partial [Vicinamibacteria bacterium]